MRDLLTVSLNQKRKRMARSVAIPLDQEEMLLKAMRNYLARPDDLQRFTRE
jgi:hypothetical protein